jgi:hypothetical protein
VKVALITHPGWCITGESFVVHHIMTAQLTAFAFQVIVQISASQWGVWVM